MNIFEEMKNKFVSSIPFINSTVQTEEDNIDLDLSDKDVVLPNPKKSKPIWKSDAVKYDKAFKETSRIKEYRRISKVPEVSSAIDEIVSECITKELKKTVKPELEWKDESNKKDAVKKVYNDAWDRVLELIKFESKGRDLFEKWYIEGRLIAESIYEEDKENKGIQKIVILSPLKFMEYRDEDNDNELKYRYVNETFKSFKDDINIYNDSQITFTKSNLYDEDYEFEVGYLDYILKTVNNMQTIEDSLVMYRYLRSIEKRIWKVPVGKMGKTKADSYITKVMNSIRNDKLFDKKTGKIKNSSTMESIVDDWVFPTKNGEGVEVDTISGDTSFITDLNDHDLFLKKTYIGMKIPVNRLDETSTLDFSGEDIIKQELKFNKHTDRLVGSFGEFLLDILKKELLSTKKVTIEEWIETRKDIIINWNKDNQVLKKVKSQMLVDRATALSEVEDSEIIGKVVSYTTALKIIFDMNDDDIKEELKLIEKEKKTFKFLNDGE